MSKESRKGIQPGPWGLRITDGSEVVHLKFPSFESLKEFIRKRQGLFIRKEWQVDWYSRRQHFYPGPKIDLEDVPLGHLWCPYCRKVRAFTAPYDEKIARCVICGISESEWYVCDTNNRWPVLKDKKGRTRYA